MTEDLQKRLALHNAGKVRSTKGYRPWEMVYNEKYLTKDDARTRELFLKTGIGRRFLKDLGL
ncbi:MAG: GIY-YIG nuclease family protein [Cyclobacteriaceae bacterium]|nr:GIY-YIG nuclease family protein [Cyclobacteriaceae bacterium]